MNFENLDPTQIWEVYVLPWGINIVLALLVFIFGKWIAKIVSNLIGKALAKTNMDDMLIKFILSIVNTLLLFFVVIASLSQLGIDTTSLIALIGAAGLAIGLALQNSLQNFAAGVMLIIFKPFKNGDLIEAGGVFGVVEEVGIFTSTLASLDNKEIIIPNGQIMGGSITNFSAKDTRRVDMVFGIGYGDDLKKAKDILVRIMEEDERILKDPEYTVAVSELGDSSVNFVVRPWVKADDYWDVLWDTTEKVKLTFDAEGISIPFPQMDVHLHKQVENT